MNRKENFTAGFIRENPVFSLYLGLCSTLAITTTLNNAIGMGVAVIVVLIMSNVIISLIRNITPSEIRIPVYIVIIATLVKTVLFWAVRKPLPAKTVCLILHLTDLAWDLGTPYPSS